MSKAPGQRKRWYCWCIKDEASATILGPFYEREAAEQEANVQCDNAHGVTLRPDHEIIDFFLRNPDRWLTASVVTGVDHDAKYYIEDEVLRLQLNRHEVTSTSA